ncbi:hypothetical protein D3C86_2012990 [compost metagenome]
MLPVGDYCYSNYSYSLQRKPEAAAKEPLNFWGNRIEVKSLEVFNVESAWK